MTDRLKDHWPSDEEPDDDGGDKPEWNPDSDDPAERMLAEWEEMARAREEESRECAEAFERIPREIRIRITQAFLSIRSALLPSSDEHESWVDQGLNIGREGWIALHDLMESLPVDQAQETRVVSEVVLLLNPDYFSDPESYLEQTLGDDVGGMERTAAEQAYERQWERYLECAAAMGPDDVMVVACNNQAHDMAADLRDGANYVGPLLQLREMLRNRLIVIPGADLMIGAQEHGPGRVLAYVTDTLNKRGYRLSDSASVHAVGLEGVAEELVEILQGAGLGNPVTVEHEPPVWEDRAE